MTNESYDKLLAEASKVYGVQLIRHTNVKASGPCPVCGGTDRFTVWLFEGNGWCHRCDYKAEFRFVPPEQRKENAAAKAQAQHEAREAMMVCRDWQDYSGSLEADELRRLVVAQGINDQSIRRWGIGYCPSCPTASEFASITFPVFYQSRLMDIRHKLLGVPAELADEVGKYRSHRPNLLPHPYNLDALDLYEDIEIVEGEKKTILIDQMGINNVVGIPGTGIIQDLLDALARVPGKNIRLAIDPDARAEAPKLAAQIARLGRHRVWIADPFMKPDDLVLKYGASTLRSVLRQARKFSL